MPERIGPLTEWSTSWSLARRSRGHQVEDADCPPMLPSSARRRYSLPSTGLNWSVTSPPLR